jgi:NAD(P)-dependent dehydrogenase (short-subunit alcohol dehydrogenase family)
MGLLDERVVIVTGGGRGLGREHCLELARHGATVIVNDLGGGLHGEASSETPADEVVAEIERAGGAASADGTSVSDFDAVGKLVAGAVGTYGRLDAVVNNAGIIRDRMITGMSEEDFDLVIAVHLKGTWNLSRHACALWRDQHKAGQRVTGRIVNTTSGAGLFGNIGQTNYGPAKAAIASLTMITAMEMEKYGVTANAVSPMARTRMTAGIAAQPAAARGWDRLDPANTSPVVAYLCSEPSGWLSGCVLRVDGESVQRLRPWDIDHERTYVGASSGPVDAADLDRGLRAAFGAFPRGLPTGSVTQ